MATTKDVGVVVDPVDVINDILPFCDQGVDGRDLLAQEDYAADAQRRIGHQPGIARQELANKQARQAAHMAAGLAQFLARRYAPGVRDDGDLDALEAAFAAVMLRVAEQGRPGLVAPDGTSLTVDKNGVLSVIQKADAWAERAEFLNKLSIGAPKFHRSTVLPADHAWPDGSFVAFEDWPEFGEVYEQGGFTGLVMPWDADTEEQAANLGKFRQNSANPTGLYLPLHGGQFFRAWVLGTDREAGGWQEDALQGHVHGYGGASERQNYVNVPTMLSVVPIDNNSTVSMTNAQKQAYVSDGAHGTPRIASDTRPENTIVPVILYLGWPR